MPFFGICYMSCTRKYKHAYIEQNNDKTMISEEEKKKKVSFYLELKIK
jgi:hypothetical protein